MKLTLTQNTLLCLVSHAVGFSKPLPDEIYETDWDMLIRTAVRNGVAPLAFTGYVKSGLNDDHNCKLNGKDLRRLKLTWMGLEIPQRKNYRHQLKVLQKITTFYENHGIKVHVIKGYPLSLCYPDPELRTSSDIDIYCGKDYKRSNELMEQKGVKVDYSEHKHSTFSINGIAIENHHSFLNVHAHPSSRLVEQWIEDNLDSHTAMLLYLIRHSAENFTASQATLRQVLDCGLYAQRYQDFIDCGILMESAEEAGMIGYMDTVTFICTEYLGFSDSLFPPLNTERETLIRAAADIIEPEFNEEHPSSISAEIRYKLRRWNKNRWKHDMVYANESLIGSFISQMWSHLLKPSTILYGLKAERSS